MEPTTRRTHAPIGPGSPVRATPARRSAAIRAVGIAVAVAGLVGACVGPSTGAPGGPDGPPGGPTTPPLPPSSEPTAASPETLPDPGGGAPSTPPGLAGRSWVAPGQDGASVAGITGTAHRLAIPAGEVPIAASRGLVATVVHGDDATGSTVRVRDIVSGRLVVEASRPEEVDSGVLVGDRILVAGHDAVRTGVDPGLVAISLVDGGATQLIEPGPAPDGWSESAGRSIVASPSGRGLVSGLCLADRCVLDVIDPGAAAVRRLVDEAEGFPRAATDEVAIVGSDDLARLRAYDLATGRLLWERSGAEFQYGYPTSDGGYVLSYVDHRDPWRFVVAVVDPRTGDERVVLGGDPNDGLRLWPGLSTDAVAVLGAGGRFEDVSQASPVVRAATLDLATGRFVPGGVTIVVAP